MSAGAMLQQYNKGEYENSLHNVMRHRGPILRLESPVKSQRISSFCIREPVQWPNELVQCTVRACRVSRVAVSRRWTGSRCQLIAMHMQIIRKLAMN
jgi:hypothetical protein